MDPDISPQEEVLSNIHLLELILAFATTLTIIRSRRVARVWRDAVDSSIANSRIQKKLFLTPILIREVYKVDAVPKDASKLLRQVVRDYYGGREYELVSFHPFLRCMVSEILAGLGIPGFDGDCTLSMGIDKLTRMAGTRYEEAFITQPPVKKIVFHSMKEGLAEITGEMTIERAGGIKFKDLIGCIMPFMGQIEQCCVERQKGQEGWDQLPFQIDQTRWSKPGQPAYGACLIVACPGVLSRTSIVVPGDREAFYNGYIEDCLRWIGYHRFKYGCPPAGIDVEEKLASGGLRRV